MKTEIKKVKALCKAAGWNQTIVEDAMVWEVKCIHSHVIATRSKARNQLNRCLSNMTAKGAKAFAGIRDSYTF